MHGVESERDIRSTAALLRLLDEGFERWRKLVGIDPTKSRFSLAEWDARQQMEDLQELRQLDPTGLSPFMLMKALVHEHIAGEKVTALDLIRGLSLEQLDRIESLREVYEFLERPEIDALIQGFIDSVRRAVSQYGLGAKGRDSLRSAMPLASADKPDVLEDWLGNYYRLAMLRRDAIKAVAKLEQHQFFHGRPGTSERFVYTTKVIEFWNVPSLLRAMVAQGARGFRGVTVCLIRDPEEALHSFFVLAVVNGESLSILTDRGKSPHPLGRRMSRRPDRAFVRRAERFWFPYELVDVVPTEEQKRLYAKARTALVPINAQAVELADFNQLDPPSAIWLTLVFELLRQEYLEQNPELPKLSYTAEMVRNPQLLLGGSTDLVVQRSQHYQPLVVAPLTCKDVTAAATASQWHRRPCGHNEWMIARYGEQVPEAALNILGTEELRAVAALPHASVLGSAEPDRFPARRSSEQKTADALVALDPLSFGTKEEIERDRVWSARYNQCKIVQALARVEFKATEAEVRSWLKARVLERREWFIEQAVRGELRTKALVAHRDFDWSPEAKSRGEVEEISVLDVIVGKKWYRHADFTRWFWSFSLSAWTKKGGGHFVCPITGSHTTRYHATFSPLDAQSLAFLLGCSVQELPWALQHWYYRDEPDYLGNSILDRLDPSDWVLHNPWCGESGFPIKIVISLSKRAVNQRRKELGLAPLAWKELEEKGT